VVETVISAAREVIPRALLLLGPIILLLSWQNRHAVHAYWKQFGEELADARWHEETR
jgi:steroid 5-alpha reductase family enzyme